MAGANRGQVLVVIGARGGGLGFNRAMLNLGYLVPAADRIERIRGSAGRRQLKRNSVPAQVDQAARRITPMDESHEQSRRELMEQIAELQGALLPDATTMRILELSRDGREIRHRLQTGAMYEQSFRDLCSLYADVLRFAQLAIDCGPTPIQPEATWLQSRAGAYCGELVRFCEALRFGDSPPKSAGKKGKLIGARMLKVLADKPEAFDWSARSWALHLKCSHSSVTETKTWKGVLKAMKIRARIEGAQTMGRSGTHQGRRMSKPKSG